MVMITRTLATDRCQCPMPAAFCRPVFDPGGSPAEKLPAAHFPHKQKTPVGALLFSANFHPPRNKTTHVALPSEYKDLSRSSIELGSTDASSSAFLHEILDLLDRGHFDHVLHVLLVLYANGIVPHLYIYWSYLKACNQRNALLFAKQLHAHLVLHGLDFVSSLSDFFVSTLFRCGGFELATQLFRMLPRRTVFTWKAIITGYIDYGLEQEAMALYEMMLKDNVEPDKYIYVSLIRACASLLDLHQGEALHADAQERFLHTDAFVGSALIYMYGKCRSTMDAENVFEGLWQRDVVSWNAMLSVYVEQGEAQKALQLYRQMNQEGPRPNNRTFVAAILACCILAEDQETVWMCLTIGEALHSDARRMGFDSDAILSNNLMRMYGKCGSITKVWQVFNEMPRQSVVSWTVMLNMYLEHGQPETTLQLYKKMQEEGVCPDERIFMVVLQACCSLAKEEPISVEGQWTRVSSLAIGKALHYDIKTNSLESDVFVTSSLMCMYGICGTVEEVENVFSGLSQRNLVSFNAMLSVYIEHGEGEMALRLYRQMKDEGVQSDERTTAIALQACCILAEKELPVVVQGRSIKLIPLDIGRSLHCDVLRDGFNLDAFLSYTLLSMYKQCGSFEEAMNLGNGPVAKTSMYWTEMLSLYAVEGEFEKALQLFKYMQVEGVSPNKWAFLMAIKACCGIADKRDISAYRELPQNVALLVGEALHVDAWKQGFSSETFIGSSLLTLYSICGDIVEAENVFAGLSQPDVVSWNAMLSAYLEQGNGGKVLRLYKNLLNEGVCQNEGTFVATLQACCMLAEKEGSVGQSPELSALEIGKALHADARKKGLDSLAAVCSTLVIMYGRCGSIMDAENMFSGLVQHDIVSWTAMLSAYTEHGEAEKALQAFRHIQKEGMTPDEQTFVSALEACAKLAESEASFSMEGQPGNETCLKIGWALHADCLSLGYDSHDNVCSNLVDMYGKCKNLVEAESTFDRLAHRHNMVLWNTMLSTYVDHGQGEKALTLYEFLQDVGVLINEFTLVCVLQACSLTGNVETCRQVHFVIECVGYDCCANLTNILTHAYGSSSSIADCEVTFDSITQPDVISWNALIGGYVRHGKEGPSLQAFKEMQHAGIISNRVTALLMLSVCSHAGNVDRGFEYFDSMFEGHGIIPGEEHYESMIDLLGRAGDFTKVKHVLSREVAHPSFSHLLSLLGACQNHGNMELGSWAFDWSMHMQPKQANAYIMMSNIHARM